MVIVKLMGGLGNQMFQYAVARAISSGKIYFDYSFLNQNKISSEHFTARKFELQIFRKLKVGKFNQYLMRLILSKNKKYALLKFLLPLKIKSINDNDINGIVFNSRKSEHLYLDGYFQDPLHFNQIRNSLIEEFTFPELNNKYIDLLGKIKSSTSVAIHVRRGDYLHPSINEYHGVLPLSYYDDAIKYLKNNIENPTYFIFSDDPDWCYENFEFLHKKTILSNFDEAWVDMNLISKCKHQIIANSSFSWWGAWLNTHTEKIIIAPKKWFNNDPTNIIPKEWISL